MNSEEIHILVVDDTRSNVVLLQALLESSGYRITQANCGSAAIESVVKDRPDLILLDVIMPGIDGFETCIRMKSDDNSAHIPIIFVTSLSHPEDIKKGFEVGAIDYILKPIQELEVLARVTNQVRGLERQRLLRTDLMKTEKMASLGKMVGNIAHEVSSPIGVLKMAIESLHKGVHKATKALNDQALKKSDLSDFLSQSAQAIDISMSNVESTSAILNSFKSVAIDQCSNRIIKIDLGEYLDTILLTLRPRLKRLDHVIKNKIPSGVLITTQPGALSQVIINLINNSILHGFESIDIGEVIIRHRVKGSLLHIEYMDNGQGMEKSVIDKIFDEYFTTKAGDGGNGLGMSIVKQLVEKELNGTISINSVINGGVKIEIVMPL